MAYKANHSKSVNKRKSPKLKLFVLSIIIFISIALIVSGYYLTEFKKKPIVEEKVNSGDMGYIYNFYVTNNPSITNRISLGESDAPITIVVYSNFDCDSCRKFISEKLPKIKKDLIDTGTTRFIHKNQISIDDYSEKNERFIYANSLACFESMKPENYWNFYLELFETSKDNIPVLAKKYGIIEELFNDCVQNSEFSTIIEDISETQNYGIDGIAPTIYIGINGRENTIFYGIPTDSQFNRAIKQKEVLIGK